MRQVPAHIFRAYDVRGIYGQDLNEDIAEAIGRAYGTYIGSRKVLVVGRDVRLSGLSLEEAIIKGLTHVGCDVVEIGLIPTPVLYFSIVHFEKEGGIMVTASHNPAQWNGFKLCKERALPCCEGMGMEEVRSIALSRKFHEGGKGSVAKYDRAISDYSGFVLGKVKPMEKMKVVLDPGNGACSIVVPNLFEKLGSMPIVINGDPDGRFPAHEPEPSERTMMEVREKVLENSADFGVGYDGDGDRALFVDESGRVLSGDVALAIFAKHYLARRPGKVIYDVTSSMAVEETVRAMGGIPIASRVGHSYIMERMVKEGAVLGGEVSSHLYFDDTFGFDDAIFASVKMAEVLYDSNMSLSELASSIPHYPSLKQKIFDCPDDVKFKVVERIAADLIDAGYSVERIDGVKSIEEDGWLLIRASNTQPQIKLSSEARTEEKLQELVALGESEISKKIKHVRNASGR